MIQRLYQ